MTSFGFEKIGITELKKCVNCKNVIEKEEFRDELSWEEYKISGLCQKCQDETVEKL